MVLGKAWMPQFGNGIRRTCTYTYAALLYFVEAPFLPRTSLCFCQTLSFPASILQQLISMRSVFSFAVTATLTHAVPSARHPAPE